MAQETTDLSALERLVREGSDQDLERFLHLLQPPEIADLIEALRAPQDRARAFGAIAGLGSQADVLRDMEDAEATALIDELPAATAATLIGEMQSDDAVDVLQAMEDGRRQEVMAALEPAGRREIHALDAFPEDCAGGIMQTELVRVRESQRARAAVEEIRRTRDEVGELHEVFVVDDEGRLRGWVKERDLILAEDDTPIRSITSPVPVRVPATMDQEDIAALVRDYDVSSVPVVDDAGRLLGRILVDDIVDVLEEEATEDMARLAGTTAEEIYEPSIRGALRARAPWLLTTFLGGTLAALIISSGDDVIRGAGKLIIFIPVIMGMGGGCAAQAATVTVRSLALGRVSAGSIGAVVAKELAVGAVLAFATGLLLWTLAWLVQSDQRSVAWIASLAVFSTITLGNFLGVLTPLVLSRLGVDPAVATNPLVTTMNDITGSSLMIVFCWLLL